VRPLTLTVALAIAACTSDPPAPVDTPDPQPDGSVGDPCVTTAGCQLGLNCSFGYCRAPAHEAGSADSGGDPDATLPIDAGPDVVADEAGQDGGPLAACTVKDLSKNGLSFAYSPSPLVAGPVTVTVTDQLTNYANVSLGFCTPNGLVTDATVNIVSNLPPYKWKFGAVTLPSGTTQMRFVADPNKATVYATQRIAIP